MATIQEIITSELFDPHRMGVTPRRDARTPEREAAVVQSLQEAIHSFMEIQVRRVPPTDVLVTQTVSEGIEQRIRDLLKLLLS